MIIKEGKLPFVWRRWGDLSRTLSLDRLVEQRGESGVFVHEYEGAEVVFKEITLRQLAERISSGKTTNAKSVHEVFKRNDNLLLGLTERINCLRGTVGRQWGELAALLFIGNGETYTRCHADPSLNLYVQIQGRKKWQLFEPSAVQSLYALPRGAPLGNVGYFSQVSEEHESSIFPAYGRVPKCELITEAGDLLFVPPFWFHSVKNCGTSTEPVLGLSMNSLSIYAAFRNNTLMALGCLCSPRLIYKNFFRVDHNVDDEIMRSCRRLSHTPQHVLREEKTRRNGQRQESCNNNRKRRSWPSALLFFFGFLHADATCSSTVRPLSVNYFITRRCNMQVRSTGFFSVHKLTSLTCFPNSISANFVFIRQSPPTCCLSKKRSAALIFLLGLE